MSDAYISEDDIIKMSLKELKELAKKYNGVFYKIKSNFTKDKIVTEIVRELQYINMRKQGVLLFDELYHDEYSDRYNITSSSYSYYHYIGLATSFTKKYIDTYHHTLRFDSIVFKILDKGYYIYRLNKYCPYEPIFENGRFILSEGGRKGSLMSFSFINDIGFSLIKDKGVLLINTIVNDYYFEKQYTLSDYTHDFNYVKSFIENKEIFNEESGECKRSGYNSCYEGLVK